MIKRNLIFSFLVLTVWNVNAQTYFGSQNVIVQGNKTNAKAVYAADIDGDGDQDILSASGSKIAWHENIDGNGFFGTHQVITYSASNAHSVYACDIDGDGDQDVLSASSDDDKIAWYENTDGNGDFGPQKIISDSADFAYSVYGCDIDGDGDQDVLSASASDDKIAWYENTDGSGTFGEQQVITTSADGAYSVYACDIDGDEDLDVLSASGSDDKIAWYENTDGNGTFGPQKNISTSANGAHSVYACDIDGDGDQDVLSASSDDDKIAWYENTDGNGDFGPQKIISDSADYAYSVYACDIDGDNDQDVLAASSFDDMITWYENTDGNGTFGTQQVITTLANGAWSVYACDIDGDGDQDVLSSSYTDGKTAWYENGDGNGTFGAQRIIAPSVDKAYSVYTSDIDGDGDQDVLSASIGDDKIAWYENTDGLGAFGAQQIITNYANGAISVFACDIDGDGDQDVLSASMHDSKIAWYNNDDGNGSFGEQQVITTLAKSACSVYACDIDGDNDQDVLSASYNDDTIAWYENTDGNGSFGVQQVITNDADGASFVYACDIDGDGDQDVLSASAEDDKIAWYENTDGSGTFGAQQIIADSVDGAYSVFACDIDGDGDQDVLSASIRDDKIAWYENTDGNGTFGIQQVITTLAEGACSVYAVDIDGDGDQDVLSASRSIIAWYGNTDGNGSFGKQQTITRKISGEGTVFAADIDSDGDQDVLSASSSDDKIAWYKNYTAKILTQPTDTKIDPGDDAEFSLDANNVETYQWQVNEGAGFSDLSDNEVYSGVATHTLTISSAGYEMNGYVYRCVLSNKGGALYSDGAALTVNENTGMHTLQEKGISVYPNPTNGKVNLYFSDHPVQKLTCTDITGNLIISKTQIQQKEVIDLSGFESGMYLISIQSDDEVLVIKVLKI